MGFNSGFKDLMSCKRCERTMSLPHLSGFMHWIKPRKTSVGITCLKAQKWTWASSSIHVQQMLLIVSQQQIRLDDCEIPNCEQIHQRLFSVLDGVHSVQYRCIIHGTNPKKKNI